MEVRITVVIAIYIALRHISVEVALYVTYKSVSGFICNGDFDGTLSKLPMQSATTEKGHSSLQT